ncbi:peptide ABC transporter permease [Fervidicella metallireducens AeB]|uniref:Peptide ABC transporter permease n=1 Tax=Fervidicella metallireducens AeB TaxID=1403537 RepID=A0A017RV79_9CLOT|nr:ABC transporter permease [Fervidicella metallireducens]EYE87820.1 peptide ABC transporter permease [Fervidicella metallireducens AeB]
MLNYIVKRIISGVITLWVVITITFILMHLIPGGPFDKEKKVPDKVKKAMEARYNLDKPLWWQYGDYLKGLVKFDLGPSFKYEGRTVNEIIKTGFPVSAQLGGVAVIFSLLLGLPFGIISALKQGKWQDNLVMFLATIGITVPSFVLATLLLYVFGLKLGWFPTMRWGTPLHYVLPVIALAGSPTAIISRLTRSSLLDVVRQDYIRTARAKGIPEKIVIYKHALKNALIPVLTYLGPLIAAVLTGSFVIEKIFTIPGLGKQFVESITNRDFTTILGTTVFYSVLLVVCNLIVDILYAVVDPRIKLDN